MSAGNDRGGDVRMSGIHISERDARDTYYELKARSFIDMGPFEDITSMTAYGLTIEWTPEQPFKWYGTMGE